MTMTQSMRKNGGFWARLALLGSILVCLGLGSAGCGRSDLVLVSVGGIEPAITELHVTMSLDGVMARNAQPTADDPDAYSFAVYKDMQRFGVEVPVDTRILSLRIDGINTLRSVLKIGSAELDLSQRRELTVVLQLP